MNRSITNFIGLKARVVQSPDPTIRSVSGKVVLETKNTFVFATEKGRKVIPKKDNEFEFSDGKVVRVSGTAIIGRPEERIAKLV